MKITHLEVIDFKKIKAVLLDPQDGKTITLTGDNAAGKSSVLDAIMVALTNRGTAKPIRDGAASAVIRLKIGDADREFEVRRKFTGKGQYLDVTAADGSKVPQAQTFLNALVGNLAFDPEEFSRMNPKQQADALREATGLDTADLDVRRKEVFNRRTEVNRQKLETEKLLANTPKPDKDVELEPVSAGALITRRDEAQVAIADQERAESGLQDDEQAMTELVEHIDALQAKIAAAEEKRRKILEDIAARKAAIASRAPKVEAAFGTLTEVNGALASMESENAAITTHNTNLRLHRERKARYLETVKASNELTQELARIDAEKQTRIAAAKMPVDGMEIGEDGVTVGGIPFEDLNTAERLKISTLVAMAMNPELRVIFVREGALLNRANIAVLTGIADERGYQTWIEKFQEEPGQTGLHIVDGEVAFADGEPVLPNEAETLQDVDEDAVAATAAPLDPETNPELPL